MLLFTAIQVNDGEARQSELDRLLGEISAGDRTALEQLYRQTHGAVYGFALSVLKNAHDAEDVLHDCYVAVWHSAGSYRSQGKPMAWLMTVTRNLCLQLLRQRKKQSELPQEDWEPYLQSRESVTPEDRLILTACMQRLSDEERQIVTLHAVSGFRHREIAALLELPLPTVLSKYSRAIKKLKQYLQ